MAGWPHPRVCQSATVLRVYVWCVCYGILKLPVAMEMNIRHTGKYMRLCVGEPTIDSEWLTECVYVCLFVCWQYIHSWL